MIDTILDPQIWLVLVAVVHAVARRVDGRRAQHDGGARGARLLHREARLAEEAAAQRREHGARRRRRGRRSP